jgi:hydroxymethylpyrimidine kinase/phosphomethylpyrimidine kinase
VVLTVGGSDASGCTGVQADLRALAALRVHAATAITAIMAQSGRGATDVYPIPGSVVSTQLGAALDGLPLGSVKTGMFASGEGCAAVTARARDGRLPNLVVDPVITSSVQSRRAVASALERLLPYALIATPNRDEASALLGWQVATPADMAGAASQLASNGPRFVVVTGGDLVAGDEAIDAMWVDGAVRFLHSPRISSRNTQGSGATFAAAIAARLALGDSPVDAMTQAKSFVSRAIGDAAGWELCAGGGPIDQFGWSSRSLFG